MNLKLNGQNGHGRPKPYLKIALLATAVLLVGFLLFRQVDRLTGSQRDVWVAKSNLARGAVLGPEDFEKKQVRGSRLPEGAVDDPSKLVGKRLARVKAAGAPLVAGDFAATGGDAGSITRLVPEGRVMMTLRVGSKSLPLTELRRGDRLDLLATGAGGSRSVASDAYFVGWIHSGEKGGGQEKNSIFGIDLSPPGRSQGSGEVSLLLALRPDDVYTMARAESVRAPLTIVLHGQSEVREGRLLELPSPTPPEVELIAGATRKSVALKP